MRTDTRSVCRRATHRQPTSLLRALALLTTGAIGAWVPVAGDARPAPVDQIAVAGVQPAAGRPVLSGPWARPRPRLDIVAERHYTLNVRARLFFFWYGRKNVGSGRVRWAEGPEGARGYELLIGSDPDRAPRRINRWGYIAERAWGSDGELLGVMTAADEATPEEAEGSVTGTSRGRYPFKAIRASVSGVELRSNVVQVSLGENLTYRDLEAVIDRLPPGTRVTRTAVPPDAERGFLAAVSHLVADTVASPPHPGTRCAYVYDRGLYDLTLESARVLPKAEIGNQSYVNVIESRFLVRNRATGKETRFQLTYGASGPLAGVPVRIVYRPRGWFETELVLDAGAR